MKHRSHAPEVVPGDLESPSNGYGGGKSISMAPPGIQPFQPMGGAPMGGGRPHGSPMGVGGGKDQNPDGMKQMALCVAGIWVLGVFLGYDYAWPLYLALDILSTVLSIPPISWIFGWITGPLSWASGWVNQGAPMVEQTGPLQELKLPTDQVATYVETYYRQFGDAALIFAAHDGYPQIVNGLLLTESLGYGDLIDAADDNGNTALIYASAKGYGQIVASLLRRGADPDVANHESGGRTALMEAAGTGHKDVVSTLRLYNATLDLYDTYGNTALHYAAYHGHLSVVVELLKGNPRTDIANSYGHTAASYAQSNRHKNIADMINRAPAKNAKAAAALAKSQAAQKAKAKAEPGGDDTEDALTKFLKSLKEAHGSDKHVNGAAEDLHKRDAEEFAPKVETAVSGITDAERKALEDQISKLKRQHEEIELKAQQKIVDLLEKSSQLQQGVEEAERDHRLAKLNNTEMSLRVQELESKHSLSELRVREEQQRADRLHEDLQNLKLDADRHRTRADAAERERDFHIESSKRHEDHVQKKQQEVGEHLTRLEKQAQDAQALREEVRRNEEDARQYRLQIEQAERELSDSKASQARSDAVRATAAGSAGTAGVHAAATPAGTVGRGVDAAGGPAAPDVPAAADRLSSEASAADQDSTEM